MVSFSVWNSVDNYWVELSSQGNFQLSPWNKTPKMCYYGSLPPYWEAEETYELTSTTPRYHASSLKSASMCLEIHQM